MHQTPKAHVVEIPGYRQLVLNFELLRINEPLRGNIKFNIVIDRCTQPFGATKKISVGKVKRRRNTDQATVQSAVAQIKIATNRKAAVRRQVDVDVDFTCLCAIL